MLSLCMVLIASTFLAMPVSKPLPPLEVQFIVTDEPVIGEETVLVLTVTPLVDTPQLTVRVHLPEGLTLVSGDEEWAGSLKRGEAKEVRVTIRVPDGRRYEVIGTAAAEFPDGARFSRSASLLIHLHRTTEKPAPLPRTQTGRGESVIEFPSQ